MQVIHTLRAVLLAGALGLGGCAAPMAVGDDSGFAMQVNDGTLVQTQAGWLRGVRTGDGVLEFRGVRYAAAPVGNLRFRAPQPVPAWEGEVDATLYGEAAVQMSAGAGAANYPGAVGLAMAEAFAPPTNISVEGSEDSLVLNVYTQETGPNARTDRPVMVWLHGGGFSYGQAASRIYQGHNLAANHDVVFVGVNHRLNMFGFLPLDTLGIPGFEGAANAGMLDLVAALEWVRDNIEQFGGDPDNVTIFGQSGGGSKVTHLMAMPEAAGLFDRAIVQSGAGLTAGSRADAAATAQAFLDNLGVSRAEAPQALRTLPVATLLEAARKTGIRNFRPSIDGTNLPRDPFSPDAPAISANVPVMVGFTKDERTLYNVGRPDWGTLDEAGLLAAAEEAYPGRGAALVAAFQAEYPDYSPDYINMQLEGTIGHLRSSTALATRKARQPGDIYTFIFAHDLPPQGYLLKSPHTAEIPYVMDNVAEAPLFAGNRPEDLRLGDIMSATWVRFARTGNPNGPGLPAWPEFDPDRRSTMIFTAQPYVQERPLAGVWALVRDLPERD